MLRPYRGDLLFFRCLLRLTDKARRRLILPDAGFDYAQPAAPTKPWIERSQNLPAENLSVNQAACCFLNILLIHLHLPSKVQGLNFFKLIFFSLNLQIWLRVVPKEGF
jgi:hypothetical protein